MTLTLGSVRENHDPARFIVARATTADRLRASLDRLADLAEGPAEGPRD